MQYRPLSFVAIGAALIGITGCLLVWLGIGNQRLFDLAVELGAFEERSIAIVKVSFGVLCALGAYLAWTVGASPMRSYAQLMILFGGAMLVILATAWPWQHADLAGIIPGAGLLLCAFGSLIYLVIAIWLFVSLRQRAQPRSENQDRNV